MNKFDNWKLELAINDLNHYRSTPHRYLFLLFEEPAGLDLAKDAVGGEEFVERRSFDAVAFVKTHQLRLASANWMRGAGDGWSE